MNNIFQYLYDKKGKAIPFKAKLIYNTPLNENDLIFKGSLYLHKTNITSLPDNLTVNGDLNICISDISYLPNNLIVNGWLDLSFTIISELPDNLIVNSDLCCKYTPLADKIYNNPLLLIKYSKQVKGKIIYE